MVKKQPDPTEENDRAESEPSSQAEAAEEEQDSSGPPSELSKQVEELEELIRESPLAAVGIAAGVGLVLGVLLSRR